MINLVKPSSSLVSSQECSLISHSQKYHLMLGEGIRLAGLGHKFLYEGFGIVDCDDNIMLLW